MYFHREEGRGRETREERRGREEERRGEGEREKRERKKDSLQQACMRLVQRGPHAGGMFGRNPL